MARAWPPRGARAWTAAAFLFIAPAAPTNAALLAAPSARAPSSSADAALDPSPPPPPDRAPASGTDPEPHPTDPTAPSQDGASPGPPRPSRPESLGVAPAVGVVLWAGLAGWWIARRRLVRLPPPHDPAVEPGQAASLADRLWPVLLLGAGAAWMAQLAAVVLALGLNTRGSDHADPIRESAVAGLAGALGAWAAGAVLIKGVPGLARALGLTPRSLGRDLRLGVGAFGLVMPLVLVVAWGASAGAALLARWFELDPPNPIAHDTLRRLTEEASSGGLPGLWWWLVVLAVVVGAPAAEELIYRGLLQRGLATRLAQAGSRAPRWWAIGLSSLIFVLMHAGVAEPHALITLAALSVGFGVAYERTGQLLVPLVMHALFNAWNVALALLVHT